MYLKIISIIFLSSLPSDECLGISSHWTFFKLGSWGIQVGYKLMERNQIHNCNFWSLKVQWEWGLKDTSWKHVRYFLWCKSWIQGMSWIKFIRDATFILVLFSWEVYSTRKEWMKENRTNMEELYHNSD